MGPEESMAVQAALGSDIALVFDECTPYHADREYTARSTERTHRWLDRCLDWHAEHGPAAQAVFGIVQGGVHEDLRRESAETVAAAGVDGICDRRARSAATSPRCTACSTMTAPMLPAEAPKHLLGIGEPDDLLDGIGLGIDVFDCAVPTRLARHGMALAPLPESRFRFDVARGALRRRRGAAGRGLSVRDLRRHTRAYLHYLVPRRGADRRPAAHPAQPHLPRAAGGRRPGGDRSAPVRRYRAAVLAGAARGRPWRALAGSISA